MARSSVKYKKVAENAIRLLQAWEEEHGDEYVHSYDEWLELLQKDMIIMEEPNED